MKVCINKYVLYLIWYAVVFSTILVIMDEPQVAGALWVVVLCLLPSVWITLRTSYLSIKIFCATLLITQLITVPIFYLQSERYFFYDYRPFGFQAPDVFPIFSILGLFLCLTACMVKFFESLFGPPLKWGASPAMEVSEVHQDKAGYLRKTGTKHNLALIAFILCLVAVTLPIKFWMFKMGIGITGAPPPELPFHLSGILTYSLNYFILILIGYLYIKTERKSFIFACILSIYAFLVGASSAAKGPTLLVTAPIIAFAWIDRRWSIFLIAIFTAGFGVTVSSASRNIVLISDGMTSGSFTDLGVMRTVMETLSEQEWTSETLLVFSAIAGRVEAFQNLLLASRFNPNAVGGSWNLLLKSINGRWADIDHDAIHMEFLGYTVAHGFYNVAASLNSWLLMAVNRNLFMILPFAAYVSSTLVILEKTLTRVAYEYKLSSLMAQAFLFLSTLWFYTGPGTSEFMMLFAGSVFLWLMTALGIKKSSPLGSKNNICL